MNQHALLAARLLRAVPYATLATADSAGAPWNSPVYAAFAPDGSLFWSSHPQAQHSRNIAARGKAFIVVYDARAREGQGAGLYKGLYIDAQVSALSDESEISSALQLLGARRGRPFLYPAKFQGDGPQRIYKATPLFLWTNDADRDNDGDFIRDFRIEIPLDELRAALAADPA